MNWVAVYHIGKDGYVAQQVVLGPNPPEWLIPISDTAAAKLLEIEVLPSRALLADDRESPAKLEERILAYQPK